MYKLCSVVEYSCLNKDRIVIPIAIGKEYIQLGFLASRATNPNNNAQIY